MSAQARFCQAAGPKELFLATLHRRLRVVRTCPSYYPGAHERVQRLSNVYGVRPNECSRTIACRVWK